MKYFIICNKNNDFHIKLKIKLEKKLYKMKWKNDDLFPNYVFCIGGDGTLLKNFRRYFIKNNKVVFIPIKDSSIGYYYHYTKNNIDELIKDIKNNSYHINKFHLLKVQTNNLVFYALNEVKIINYHIPIKFDLRINDLFFKYVCGSGIVASTSTGSTGFIKSINGSIIFANQILWQIKEIAPINNKDYHSINSSIILDNNMNIEISNFNNNNFALVIDNIPEIDLRINQKQKLFISCFKNPILIVGVDMYKIENKIKKISNIFL